VTRRTVETLTTSDIADVLAFAERTRRPSLVMACQDAALRNSDGPMSATGVGAGTESACARRFGERAMSSHWKLSRVPDINSDRTLGDSHDRGRRSHNVCRDAEADMATAPGQSVPAHHGQAPDQADRTVVR
jgi:hypothetical protein